MSDNSTIEGTDATWNPVTGCSKVSAGCTNCYAEAVSHRFGFTSKPWNEAYASENVQLHPDRLGQPLRWKRPRKIFVNSMSDLFHEQVPFEFIDQVFGVMALSSQHMFQVLTKRPHRMLEYLSSRTVTDFSKIPGFDYQGAPMVVEEWHVGFDQWPLPNVWLGVSVENQQAAEKRIPLLLQTPAVVRFLSCEPLLGPVDGSRIPSGPNDEVIDWVIVGGESGPNARPMHPDWARRIRDQCQALE